MSRPRPNLYLTDSYFRDALSRRERLSALQQDRLNEEERQIEAIAWLVVMGVAWSAVAVVWVLL